MLLNNVVMALQTNRWACEYDVDTQRKEECVSLFDRPRVGHYNVVIPAGCL